MSTLQDDFVAALAALAPEGVTARTTTQWANTGSIFYQKANFQTLLGVHYDFQPSYARFNLTETTEAERDAIGAEEIGLRPDGFTRHGWGLVHYVEGDLAKVRDGVAYLLRTRLGEAPSEPGRELTDTQAMNAIAGYVNAPGDVEGGDFIQFVEQILPRTGRPVLDNADDDTGPFGPHLPTNWDDSEESQP